MLQKLNKESILAIKDGESLYLNLGEESGAEIWLKNDRYFLFEIPLYGGMPRFYNCYTLRDVDSIINAIQSWT
jgi:hypothetical protein